MHIVYGMPELFHYLISIEFLIFQFFSYTSHVNPGSPDQNLVFGDAVSQKLKLKKKKF